MKIIEILMINIFKLQPVKVYTNPFNWQGIGNYRRQVYLQRPTHRNFYYRRWVR